ncbi:MAG: alanine--tRNA ligase-related protein, partial [bacterium]|nr:alanine--tRNA ligase-related protein [bacterium]
MTSGEIRQAYLDFFTSSPRNHKRIDAAPLVLHDDPTTLFTSAGMQPLVPYLKGEPHPSGSKRLVNSQPSFRTQDIEEVGDNRHITFFEMLGNWSFGDYFKDEQLFWVWEFLTKELGLSKERLFVTIFEGAPKIPKDEESEKIWRSFGVSDDHIRPYDASKNWWSRSGNPDQMSIGDIGGPDSEIFFDL